MSPASIPRISAEKLSRKRRSGGFTLIELLIVLLVVGLISGILMTAFERVLDILQAGGNAFFPGTKGSHLTKVARGHSVPGSL